MDIDSIFSPGGELDSALPGFSFREGQLEMARLVEKAMREDKHLVVEAGTGIGKSFAYLAPAFLQIASDESSACIVATSTITLQKQLYDKDIPLLKGALGLDVPTAILFGRSNYLCLRRYEDQRLEKESLKVQPSDEEKAFDEWVDATDTGALPELDSEALGRLFSALASDEKDCPSFRCPYYSRCFFYSARRAALKARIVVTNHHLLLLDARNRAENGKDFSEDAVLPGYRYAILDEAHHIEDEATEVLSDAYSSDRVSRYIDYLTRKERRFGSASILDFLSIEEKDRGIGARIKERIAHIRTMLQEYDRLLSSILGADRGELLLTPGFYERCRDRLREGEAISEELRRIHADVYSGYSESPAEENASYMELLVRYTETLASYADVLSSFIRFSDWDERIPYAVERGGRWEIRLAPMDTGPVLSRMLLRNISSMIYSSATVSIGDSFEYFARRSGLAEERERMLSASFGSPFRYERNLMLLVPQDGRSFSSGESASYAEYVSSVVKDAIQSSGGGALVLFTSKEMMRSVYQRISGDIDDLLLQDDRASRASLLASFRERKDSSLLAVSSFWEGIDAPGDTLRLVIIVKLPFSVPSTPIAAARSAHLEKSGGRPFMEIAVPEATLRLKQGLGRLIRNEEDRGVVLILDTRILSTYYGRAMLSALPRCYVPEDTMIGNIPDKIERFLF